MKSKLSAAYTIACANRDRAQQHYETLKAQTEAALLAYLHAGKLATQAFEALDEELTAKLLPAQPLSNAPFRVTGEAYTVPQAACLV